MKTFFRLDLSLAKGTIDDLLCKRLLRLVRLNKNASYNKVLREEIKFLKKDSYKSKTTAIAKSFLKNRLKKRKYFSAQQYQNFMKF